MFLKATIIAALLFASSYCAWAAEGRISGHVTDTQGQAVAGTRVHLTKDLATTTGPDGGFVFGAVASGTYEVTVDALGLAETTKAVQVGDGGDAAADFQLSPARRNDAVTVTADVKDVDVRMPDPAEKVFASDDLLDANPGRPGAPVSIPGYPVETASSGIKAPQYFAPGVAGDHGEPIAQFIQVGGYLVPNNLSANAHGNGYTDPNIYIGSVIESVQVDGGAFNVREGNHALNLGTTYSMRSHLDPFVMFTGDQHDATGTGGFSPSMNSWVAVEGSWGNGFLDRPEHRKQFKVNGGDVFHLGRHTVTLYGIGYYASSYIAGLIPIHGFNTADAATGWTEYPDTIDPRQKDQTHTSLVALNDMWALSQGASLQFSGFFRTYNLALYSDFGDGLIRQSEFRTVAGGSVVYQKRFSRLMTLLAGTDYEGEAPRRDDLDHYGFYNPVAPTYYRTFTKVDGSNVTIAPVSPYVAAEGELTSFFRYYVGLRRDEIFIDNQDLVTPSNSSSTLVGLNLPKATLTFFPKDSWFVPEVAVSFGKSFFTEDPRIGAAFGTGETADPVETARSWQMVATKHVRATDFRLTLGHETQSAEYGKIDPDTGLQEDLGPGRIRYLAMTVRQSFAAGSVEATFEQADARDLNSRQVLPEAPRMIGDFSWTYQKLPFHLQAKGEFEYVGRKVVGNGCSADAPDAYCLGVPNKEFRLAVARGFHGGKVTVGVNTMIGSGYTGQTVENFASDYRAGYAGPLPVPENPVAEVVGVRVPSYASLNVSYRLGK